MKCRTKFCLSFHKVIVMEIAIKSKFVLRKQTPFRTRALPAMEIHIKEMSILMFDLQTFITNVEF